LVLLRVPCLYSSEGGESVYALHSWMSMFNYMAELEVECPDDDDAFVQATATIRG
jgi:hypothetical protein